MRIGVDLDGTVYGMPEFFREFINAMHNAGHELICVSNHTPNQWKTEDVPRLENLGIDHSKIDISILNDKSSHGKEGKQKKIDLISQCDIAFDDLGHKLQSETKTPIMTVPRKTKAGRWKLKKIWVAVEGKK